MKKKSDSLFVGWQERYFILYNDKILYKCKKYDQAYKGCIKLKHHKCQLINQADTKFAIHVMDINKTVQIKAATKNEKNEWVNQIKEVLFNINQESQEQMIYKPEFQKIFEKSDYIPLKEFTATIKTGDIVLFSDSLDFSVKKLGKGFSKPKFNKMGMILKDGANCYVCYHDAV